MNSRRIVPRIVAGLLAGWVSAAPAAEGLAVGVDAGTLGAGVSLSKALDPKVLNLELDLNAPLQRSYSLNNDGTHYSGNLRVQGIGLLAHYSPWANLFHFSAGVFYDNNHVGMTAQPTDGAYTLDGQSFTTAQLSSLRGEIRLDPVAPYLGIGLGDSTASPGWHVTANAGLLYQGVRVDLTGNTPYATGSPAYNNLFAAMDAQRRMISSDADDLKWYPALTLGLQYRF
jgi:hypothetical protein